jgi:hypothetical protein
MDLKGTGCDGTDYVVQDYGLLTAYCECGNEPSGPIKIKRLLDQLSDYHLLKKGPLALS